MNDPIPVAPAGSGYVFAITDYSEFYIPGALHVERDDALFRFPDDETAALAAERDGFSLIHGMEDVPDGVYLDTEENRAVILHGLEEFPEYRNVAHTMSQQPEMDVGPTF